MTTAQDFLHLLPIVADRGWRVNQYTGDIRDGRNRCPLCALAHEVSGGEVDFQNLAWSAIGGVFGGSHTRAVNRVVNAAETPSHHLRPALMAALGMKP